RRKDLGQKDMALLAASSTKTPSAVRREEDLSVMTYYLLGAINAAPASLTLDDAFGRCKVEMQGYFDRTNRAAEAANKPKMTPHEPQLFNYSTRPMLLKP